MSQRFANNAASALSASASMSDTAMSVANGAVFPQVSGGDYFAMTLYGLDSNGNETGWEIVKVTGVSGNALTVVRAQEGTAAKAWPSGTRAELRLTATTLSRLAEGFQKPSAMSVTYTNGQPTQVIETISGASRTTTIAYLNGLVSTVAVSYGGVTRTETYTYTDGVLTGMTATEV